MRLKSSSLVWPNVALPLPSSNGVDFVHAQEVIELHALLEALTRLERVSPDELHAGQSQQLVALTSYMSSRSRAYRQRLIAAGMNPDVALTTETLQCLPVLSRRALQAGGSAWFCPPPPEHFPVEQTRTSGSSGEPVVVERTRINHLYWLAYGMREHLWWQRDFSGALAVIRANLINEQITQATWGPPASLFAPTGPGHALSMANDTAKQAHWLTRLNPRYLLTLPNNLADLVRYIDNNGLAGRLTNLHQVRCLSETVTDELRAECRRVLSVPIADSYSTQEFGIIAIQCPASGHYHVMAENLLVEVINHHGRPCAEGESGELVITDLHNFATPLIRYAIGDYAVMGGPCSCGRSLPTLRRIMGRSRHMAIYPDGTRRWPRIGYHQFRDVAPICQFQLVQVATDAIHARFVVERALTTAEEMALTAIIREAMGYTFTVNYEYVADAIPRGPGGKFEEFICRV